MTTATQLLAADPAEVLERLEIAASDTTFWQAVAKSAVEVMYPVFVGFYLAGMQAGLRLAKPILAQKKDTSQEELDILISDPEFASQTAMRLRADTEAWWQGLDRTTHKELFRTLEVARRDGHTMKEIMSGVEKIFGKSRAQAIAVTETTRLFGAGQQASYGALGVEWWNWMTAEDSRVDPDCDNLSAGGPYPMTLEFAPRHVSCRCFPAPALEGPKNVPATADPLSEAASAIADIVQINDEANATLSRLYDLRGYNAKPEVIQKSQLDQYVARGEREIYRGVRGERSPADVLLDLPSPHAEQLAAMRRDHRSHRLGIRDA